MPDDFFDELIGRDPDELDIILDKIKNRWDTDLTRSIWDDGWIIPEEKERDDEEPPKPDLPKRTNRSRKNNKRNRRRK